MNKPPLKNWVDFVCWTFPNGVIFLCGASLLLGVYLLRVINPDLLSKPINSLLELGLFLVIFSALFVGLYYGWVFVGLFLLRPFISKSAFIAFYQEHDIRVGRITRFTPESNKHFFKLADFILTEMPK
jgi:hypothetical protein